ncbi:MAG: hypothetical protein PSV22_07305 [Pseudolabrys sp.]|nr:hypothetical protein [Pseudolabrys sp.]
MKKHYHHTAAVDRLVTHALPTDAELDAMDATQVAAFLSSQGVDVGKFRAEMKDLKKQIAGKLNLAQARQLRLAEEAAAYECDLSHMHEEQFKSELLAIFGSYEAMPLAARNHKSMNREDWESLYRDHCIPPKK